MNGVTIKPTVRCHSEIVNCILSIIEWLLIKSDTNIIKKRVTAVFGIDRRGILCYNIMGMLVNHLTFNERKTQL